MNNFSCSLSCNWMAVIDCLFYASGSLSWDVSWEYIAKLLVERLYSSFKPLLLLFEFPNLGISCKFTG